MKRKQFLVISPPAREWLSLLTAALQPPDGSAAETSSQFLQRICDVTCATILDTIFYDEESELIQIEPEGGGYNNAWFRVGDEVEGIEFARNPPSAQAKHSASSIHADIHNRLELALLHQIANGRALVYARIGSPVAEEFTEIPLDAFRLFHVVDWRRGVAESASGERLYSIYFSKGNASLASAGVSTPALPGSKPRGRPQKYPWELIRAEAFRLMDFHGDFSPDDAEWSAQARLEDALKGFCETRFGEESAPALSTLRMRISDWLHAWRSENSASRA